MSRRPRTDPPHRAKRLQRRTRSRRQQNPRLRFLNDAGAPIGYADLVNPHAEDRTTLITRLGELFEPRPEVLEAYLFGSTARCETQPHSDLDIAVVIDQDKAEDGGFGYRAALTAALMAGLATNAVDVVVLNRASPLLYHRVLRDGVRILSRDLRATTTREARALSRYFDFIPQLDKIDTALPRAAPPRVAEP